MFCKDCGTEIKESDRFCYKCGSVITKKSETVSQVAVDNLAPQYSSRQPQVYRAPALNPKELPTVKTKKMCSYAVVSFVLSFFLVFGSLPALIFSLLSLIRMKKQKCSGKPLAIFGLCFSALTLLIFIIVIFAVIYDKISRDSGGGTV